MRHCNELRLIEHHLIDRLRTATDAYFCRDLLGTRRPGDQTITSRRQVQLVVTLLIGIRDVRSRKNQDDGRHFGMNIAEEQEGSRLGEDPATRGASAIKPEIERIRTGQGEDIVEYQIHVRKLNL